MQNLLFAAVFASCEHDFGWNMQLKLSMLQHAWNMLPGIRMAQNQHAMQHVA